MTETAFTVTGQVLHSDPHLSLAASYTPLAGSPQAVRVIPRYDVEVEALLSTGTRMAAFRVDMLVSDVPTRPVDGATLVVDGVTYRVRSATKRESGVYWALDLDRV